MDTSAGSSVFWRCCRGAAAAISACCEAEDVGRSAGDCVRRVVRIDEDELGRDLGSADDGNACAASDPAFGCGLAGGYVKFGLSWPRSGLPVDVDDMDADEDAVDLSGNLGRRPW